MCCKKQDLVVVDRRKAFGQVQINLQCSFGNTCANLDIILHTHTHIHCIQIHIDTYISERQNVFKLKKNAATRTINEKKNSLEIKRKFSIIKSQVLEKSSTRSSQDKQTYQALGWHGVN